MIVNPETINISSYRYDLPAERIAQHPLAARDQSRLLVYRDGIIQDQAFRQLPDLIAPNSVMVFNETRVIPARLLFQKTTGAAIEIFCLEPNGEELEESFRQTSRTQWKCLVGQSKKWKEGVLTLSLLTHEAPVEIHAERIGKAGESSVVRFSWTGGYSFARVLELAGRIPLPPYISRSAEADDSDRYQTLYAHHNGSVAAPTAGLHFTQPVMDQLIQKGIIPAFLTLHVGAGTFLPVSSTTAAGHQMHTERIAINKQTVEQLVGASGSIIAVGTTSMRTLESLYHYGVRLLTGKNHAFDIGQWEPYGLPKNAITPQTSLQAILEDMQKRQVTQLHGTTQLMIVPGYTFRLVNGLVTNFHSPGSSLLLLVAAFVGEPWKDIYNHALQHQYRFLSYGDCNLYL